MRFDFIYDFQKRNTVILYLKLVYLEYSLPMTLLTEAHQRAADI